MSKHMCLTLTLEDLTHMVITYGLTTENPNKYIFLWFLFTSIEFPWYFNEF